MKKFWSAEDWGAEDIMLGNKALNHLVDKGVKTAFECFFGKLNVFAKSGKKGFCFEFYNTDFPTLVIDNEKINISKRPKDCFSFSITIDQVASLIEEEIEEFMRNGFPVGVDAESCRSALKRLKKTCDKLESAVAAADAVKNE